MPALTKQSLRDLPRPGASFQATLASIVAAIPGASEKIKALADDSQAVTEKLVERMRRAGANK